MSEAGDYTPGAWAGHDFDAARNAYKAYASRSYSDAVNSGKTVADLIPETLKTESTHPLVILCDVTGSMASWPATIFSKLPYLEHEAKTEYLGDDVEVSFGAVGDQFSDRYSLQARPFDKSVNLEARLKELIIEGGGGGSTQESYELAALYYATKTEMPKAIKPVVIFIGDESPYDSVSVDSARRVRCTLQSSMNTKAIFEALKNRFEVFFIQKPYSRTFEDETSRRVHNDWVGLLGEDHIARLDDPNRVVDVIFGILAQLSGKVAYFKKEIEDRQTLDQVKTVYKSLETIHSPGLPAKGKTVKKLDAGKSRLHKPSDDDDGSSTPLL